MSDAEEALQKEKERARNLNDDKEPRIAACIICTTEPREICWRECGHIVACAGCAQQLDRCPFCRKEGETMKVFVPV